MAGTSEKPEYVLFFTESCKFCKNMLSKLKSKPELLKKFNVVDIDKIPAIPDEIDEVPCIYDGKTVYKGMNAFKWLNEKMSEFLSPANDGLLYSFIDGQEEQIFGNYSLLEQLNGSHGMGSETDGIQQPSNAPSGLSGDPTRMMALPDNSNKNRTLESLVSSRSMELN